MKNRILSILTILLFILISASCSKYDQKLVVTDVLKTQVIKLHKKISQGNIYSMGIRGTGNLSGEAQITLMLNDQPYKTAQMNDKVSFVWGGDWYSDSMELRYQPIKIDSGTLVIEYSFYD